MQILCIFLRVNFGSKLDDYLVAPICKFGWKNLPDQLLFILINGCLCS